MNKYEKKLKEYQEEVERLQHIIAVYCKAQDKKIADQRQQIADLKHLIKCLDQNQKDGDQFIIHAID